MLGWLQDWFGGVRAGWLIRRYDPWNRLGYLRHLPPEDDEARARIGLALTDEAALARKRRG